MSLQFYGFPGGSRGAYITACGVDDDFALITFIGNEKKKKLPSSRKNGVLLKYSGAFYIYGGEKRLFRRDKTRNGFEEKFVKIYNIENEICVTNTSTTSSKTRFFFHLLFRLFIYFRNDFFRKSTN